MKESSCWQTFEVEEGVVDELCLGPVLEPDEVDVLGEGRVAPTQAVERRVRLTHDQAHTAVVAHRPETTISFY
jgi:hypothetical protein